MKEGVFTQVGFTRTQSWRGPCKRRTGQYGSIVPTTQPSDAFFNAVFL